MEKEYFEKLEDVLGEMESLKRVIGLMLSEFLEFRANALNQNEIIERYTIVQTLSNSIFELLCFQTKELESFIETKIETQ